MHNYDNFYFSEICYEIDRSIMCGPALYGVRRDKLNDTHKTIHIHSNHKTARHRMHYFQLPWIKDAQYTDVLTSLYTRWILKTSSRPKINHQLINYIRNHFTY